MEWDDQIFVNAIMSVIIIFFFFSNIGLIETKKMLLIS